MRHGKVELFKRGVGVMVRGIQTGSTILENELRSRTEIVFVLLHKFVRLLLVSLKMAFLRRVTLRNLLNLESGLLLFL